MTTQAVAITLRATFQASGQNCMGCERVLIQNPIFDRTLARLVKGAAALRQGPPLRDATAIDIGERVSSVIMLRANLWRQICPR